MLLPSELFTALNAQMNREQSNARFYEACANRCEALYLTGFAALMRKQAAGETEHAAKVRDYLTDRNLEPMNEPLPGEYIGGDMRVVLAQVLAREQATSDYWQGIYQLAGGADDVPTLDLAQWFMREQVEEERLATEWLGRVLYAADNSAAILALDAQAKGA